MSKIGELYQAADWKSEKHVPVIECPDEIETEKMFDVKISLGKEVSHPNTTEHHIRWIELFFHPEGENYTWWDYKTGARKRNVGWRIDYFFIHQRLRPSLDAAYILKEVGGSDHCPIGINLKFS